MEMSGDKIAIEFNGAYKKGRRIPVGPLNLRIPQGYIVAIVGPNGSGKSTMMNLMLQTIYPDEGGISWFGGQPNEVLSLTLRQGIGYVPENPVTEENHMTADSAAAFRSRWYPAWDQARFEALMTRFKVPRRERLIRMSKGERRKFEIAAVLAARPKLLLLDEPSSGLDPFAWRDMIEELRDCMNEEDVTIVLSTHVVEEVKRLADYIVLVHQGQVLGMAEKDVLLGSWSEFWIRGADRSVVETIRGVVACSEEGPSIWKLVVRDSKEIERGLSSGSYQIIRSRSLELEDILELWIRGYKPEDLTYEEKRA